MGMIRSNLIIIHSIAWHLSHPSQISNSGARMFILIYSDYRKDLEGFLYLPRNDTFFLKLLTVKQNPKLKWNAENTFLLRWSVLRMCYWNTNNSFKFIDPYFAVKWYPFLYKITGKHPYSVTTSQRFFPDNGRVVLKVSEINVIFYCHFIFQIFHLTQNCDYGTGSDSLLSVSRTLKAELKF